MTRRFSFVSLVCLWLLAFSGRAQVLTPTVLTASLSQPTARVGSELELVIKAKIQPRWHLYATDFSDEVGPAVFTLIFTKNPAYELVGKAQSIGSKHAHDDVFNGEVAFFEQAGEIRQRIRMLKPGPLIIQATAEYQSCSDADGRCVPGSSPLSFGSLNVTAAAAPAALKHTRTTSTKLPADKAVAAVLPVASDAALAPGTAITNTSPATLVTTPAPKVAIATATVAASPNVSATSATPAPVAAATAGMSLWSFGLLAFLSGLAALLTPCVFPMVPLTVSLFTGNNDSRRRGISKALVYGASIIGIYTLVGVVVARLLGAEGPNFLATHWLPNLIFFVVFVAFGLSFLGLFEITLPSDLVNRADRQADKGGWGGIFFAAFTLVLVSFSCTGPIVATILSLSAQGQTLLPVVGMVGFSLAFALPFTLFAIFPAWLKNLPRSGGWLNTVKVTLGFVELMLAFKFLSTVDLTYHWHLLDRGVYLTVWIALSLMLGLYLLGKLKLSHDSDLPHLSVGRVLLATLALGFVVYLVPGLFGAPLPQLAGYLPPQTSRDFSLAATPANSSPVVSSTSQPASTALTGETPRFASFLELPLGLHGYFDLEQAKRVARQQHKPIFIDFTGHGCVNCRKMEASVWSDPVVLQKLRDDYVVVALYVDDKTELPRADWYTSPRDHQLKTSLGKQNADLQLSRYGVNAQPYYVLLDPDQAGPAPLVAPVTYEPDATRFAEFLDAGAQKFHQLTMPVAVR